MGLKKKSSEIGSARAAAWGVTSCPICGRDHHCVAIAPGEEFDLWSETLRKRQPTRVDGAVLCMSPPEVGRGAKVNGYVALGSSAGSNGGRYFVPSDGGRPMSAEELLSMRARREAEIKRAQDAEAFKRKMAVEIWTGATPRDDRAAAYFAGRGVPIAAGRDLPLSLRYAASIEYRNPKSKKSCAPGPAVIAAVTNAAGVVVAVHRLYLGLDGGSGKRRPEDCDGGAAKMLLGAMGGCAVRLGAAAGVGAPKTLVVCEGVETGMMIREASPRDSESGWEVWSCVSGNGLLSVEIDAATLARVGRIVVAGDLDLWNARKSERPGHAYATRAAERLRAMHPNHTVTIAIPGHADAESLVDSAGAPKTEDGADWLDVGRLDISGVTRAILSGSASVSVPPPAEWESARTRASESGSPEDGMSARTRASESGSPEDGMSARTRASESGSPEDGMSARTRASAHESHEQGGSGGGVGVGGGGGGGDGDDGGHGVWNADGYFEEDGKKILPKGDLRRARIAIRVLFMPPEGRRAGERFTLAWWEGAQQWLRFDGRAYETVHADAVRGLILELFVDWHTKNAEGEIKNVALSTAQAASIVEALKTDCTVRVQGLPAWVPATIGADGRPLFDTRREAPALPATFGRACTVFENGLLDLDDLRSGVVSLAPHTTLLVSTNALPFEFPADEVARELARDPSGEERGGQLCASLCPRWIGFVSDLARGDDDVPKTLQNWFGYLLSPTCEYEKALYLIGRPGGGKGTILDVCRGLVGDRAYAASKLSRITGQFAMGPLIGARVIGLDEMGAGHTTDVVEATSALLSIIGNAPQTLDLKNRDAMPSVVLNAKVMATGNRLVRFRDPSDAFGRRMIFVRVVRTSPRQDPAFKPAILKELRGIMVWAVFGLLDLWKTGGFVQPGNGQELRRKFRRLSSPVAAFVQDCAVLQGDGDSPQEASLSVKSESFYAMFEQWSKVNGMKPLTMEDFSADLAAITEDFREDVLAVGDDEFNVWWGLRPKLDLDKKPRAEWDADDLAVSSGTHVAPNQVVKQGRDGPFLGYCGSSWSPRGFKIKIVNDSVDA